MGKHNPVCPECTGWVEIVVINNEDWGKCRLCGMMKKIPKISITPVGKDD